MAIPTYDEIMLPLLEFHNDKKEYHNRELIDYISKFFKLSEDEKDALLPSGQESYISNRVGWAKSHLKHAGLLESTQRGYSNITDRGLKVLSEKPEKIDNKYLERFPEFIEFFKGNQKKQEIKDDIFEKGDISDQTPTELIEKGYSLLNSDLSQQLLEKLRNEHFSVLEKIVLNLLSSMGYGEGKVIGKTGDGGVDGYVDQDKLGLDQIYFQAKRYSEKNPVPASQLRDFIGSLELKGVKKGVFITTSKFPNNAENLISKTSKSIILIDGDRLAKLMIDYDIGVATEKNYKIKRMDSDFFDDL
jgi:restriction system protein